VEEERKRRNEQYGVPAPAICSTCGSGREGDGRNTLPIDALGNRISQKKKKQRRRGTGKEANGFTIATLCAHNKRPYKYPLKIHIQEEKCSPILQGLADVRLKLPSTKIQNTKGRKEKRGECSCPSGSPLLIESSKGVKDFIGDKDRDFD